MRNQSGFTIIELLVTVAVVGTLIAIALPNYNLFVKNNCLTTTTNNIVTSFQFARSEAIKRNNNVGVDTASGWASGWRVFVDDNDDYNYDAGTDELLREITTSCGQGLMTITEIGGNPTSNPTDGTSNDTNFIYEPDGFIDSAGTFNICDDRTGETGREIVISITGRPSTNSEFTCS